MSNNPGDAVRAALGVHALIQLLGQPGPWTTGAQVAERFRTGPVFLAGDAAHRLTPAGGMGMITGIHDVHNPAWKLAAVIKGWAGDGLLEAYHAETAPDRRPKRGMVAGELGLFSIRQAVSSTGADRMRKRSISG